MSQKDWELWFWRGELEKGESAFLEQRERDWRTHLSKFPEMDNKKKILEVGTGLVSVFEFSGKRCVTIDPLQDEYLGMCRKPDSKVDYRKDWDDIKPESFDEVLCVNVIDHTPDPVELIDQIRTALKPGGTLYFEVNFDGSLSPAHYGLWNPQVVEAHLKGFELLRNESELNLNYNQTRYWAVYKKI